MKLATLKPYVTLMRLQQPIGIYLLLWPTLWGLWFAGNGSPPFFTVMIFILGVIIMRSAGCIINDIWDRDKDGFVTRTQCRPLVLQQISVQKALMLFVSLLIIALCLVFQLNRFTIALSFCGALFAIAYPLLKRVTHLPQLGLGIAFSWGIPMGYAALTNTIPFQAWILFFAALLWPVIYDTQYAMADRADDIKIGIKSTAILFGRGDKYIIGLLQVLFLVLLWFEGDFFELHICYFLSLLVAGILFGYQQFLIRDRDPQKCFRAFLNNRWIGGVIFFGILLGFQL